jgi:tetratricopeptide (TPR) repeat protein
MAEAQRTTNPVRLLMLALQIREGLEEAYDANPRNADVLVDLVRFHARAPRLAGGDSSRARQHAADLATVHPGLGHFARGYLAYGDKQFGLARQELQLAVKLTTGAHQTLALQWLGWLSQESRQYDDAFAIWERLRGVDPRANYEIGRTAMFCHCETERGRVAIEGYLKANPRDADARKVLAALR